MTNDPKRPRIELTITGEVEKFVTIAPSRVTLKGHAGEKIQSTVEIIPEPGYPFKILDVQALNPSNVLWTLNRIDPAKGSGYRLTVENLKADAGRYFDLISIKTDNSLRPVIKINVYGNIIDPKGGEKNKHP